MRRQPVPALPVCDDRRLTELIREAADRSLPVRRAAQFDTRADTPSLAGTVLMEEVQPGLLVSGYDVAFKSDGAMSAEIVPSVACAIFLDGEVQDLHIEGEAPIAQAAGRVMILGHGEPRHSRRPWRRGQRSRAFGVTLHPEFFDRFAGDVAGDGLMELRSYLAPGVYSALLPRSANLIDLAQETLAQPYGGALRTLHRESQALRFVCAVAASLEGDQRLIHRLGRRHAEHIVEARDILDRSLVDPPKVMTLARRLGISVTTLQSNFRTAYGTTVFGYVRQRRLDMARHLILDRGLGIAEAGYKVGFNNPAAFTAAYRRHFGKPPSLDG